MCSDILDNFKALIRKGLGKEYEPMNRQPSNDQPRVQIEPRAHWGYPIIGPSTSWNEEGLKMTITVYKIEKEHATVTITETRTHLLNGKVKVKIKQDTRGYVDNISSSGWCKKETEFCKKLNM